MPIAFTTINRCTIDVGAFHAKKQGLTVKRTTDNIGVDLLFETRLENQKYALWEKAILEAQEINRSKEDRLKQARNKILLLVAMNSSKSRPSTSIMNAQRRSSADIELSCPLEAGK